MRRLRKDAAWRVLHEDEVSILFARNGTTPAPERQVVQHGTP
ncbi:MAG: hypothetical protein U0835_09505 [Isosphaeraceae bacterium]